jgi:allantoinase
VAVHAEDDALVRERTALARASGTTGAREFLATRPVEAELQAIERALEIAREARCSLHIVHVSCGAGVTLVAEARAAGLDPSCETCPHYLVLSEEDLERLGAIAKCTPPLRPSREQDDLWAAIADGTLPIVASDHSPSPPELKGGDDLLSAWGGIAGAQTTLPLLLTEGHRARQIPIEQIAELTAGFPARRFCLDQKGRLEPGADADLALVAPEDAYVLDADDLLTRHPVSPFLGRLLHGRVVRTLLRGRTVFAGGEARGAPTGSLVTPSLPRATAQEPL